MEAGDEHMTGKPAPVFLHRPQGVDAMPIDGGGTGRPYKPVRAVLQTAHGGVLVRSIVRQPDGTFTGDVYGIMPREPGVARGERVRFEESQIFTFKSGDTVDAELAEMQHAFEEGLREIEAQPVKGRAPVRRSPREIEGGLDVAAPPDSARAVPAAAIPEPAPPAVRRALEELGAQADQGLSVAEAMAILCPREQHGRETKEAHMENDFAKPASPEEAAPRPDARNEEPIACMECGALLPPVPVAADPAETPPATRIACPRCGRINDIAEAKAADLSRRRAHTAR